MKKWILLLFTVALFLSEGFAFAQPPLQEEKALDLVFLKLKKSLPARGLSTQCVSVLTEETTPSYFEFAVREKHGGKCKGDPSVAPIVDRYRVLKKNGKIQRYDPISDSWS